MMEKKNDWNVESYEGWREAIENHKTIAISLSENNESAIPKIILFHTEDPNKLPGVKRAMSELVMGAFVVDTKKEEQASKVALTTYARLRATLGNAIGAIVIVEGYVLFDENARQSMRDGIPPSKHPERQHRLIVSGEHREFGTSLCSTLIRRSKPRVANEWVAMAEFGVLGSYSNLITKHVVNPGKRTALFIASAPHTPEQQFQRLYKMALEGTLPHP